jgi:nitrous oxidase accessory protein
VRWWLMLLLVPLPAQAAEWIVGQDAPTVREAIDQAIEGDVIVLPPGTWPGPVVLDKAVTLTSRGGTLDGADRGTVLKVLAPGARVSGLTVRGSGVDRGGPDSCIWVGPDADGAQVLDSELTDCTFGIWVHEADDVIVRGNHVVGRLDIKNRSNRGNGVHLFDATRAQVVGNRVEKARDGVYVSACEDSLIAENVVTHQRYGIHYMYSDHNTIRDNIATHNSGGIALMQSRNLIVEGNTASHNDRHGILFRDAQYSRIAGNVVENNAEGMFFFSSLDNQIVDNRVAHNEIGARVWAGCERNVIEGNDFVGNQQQVYYVASSDQEWGGEAGNHFSDYLGWDQDADGRGDRPYRVESFRSNLLHRYPSAALLLNSPALELITRLQDRMPALRTPTVIEPAPAMAAKQGAR